MQPADPNNAERTPRRESGVFSGDQDAPLQVPIPEHQLLRRIGRGSYGDVWLARNMMGVYRAVKIVFRKSFESDRPFERELSGIRRFEPVSRLHEGFIDILQVGLHQEREYFYYIMELGDDQVTGQNIDPATYAAKTLGTEITRRGKLPLQECLQFGIAVTHALAELHKRSLVHRDIKPSNLIFVDGVPKLADIGLVASVNEARSFVGTEGFIPPEGPGTPQADIYSFGKVLYEASTGRDRHDFPEMPTHWGQSKEYAGLLELNEIILAACQLNPRDRYASVWDMHADLVVLLNGKSIKRLRILERRWQNLKRATGIAALIVGVLGIIAYQVYREWWIATDARRSQVRANVTHGSRAMDSGDWLGALPYFAEAVRLDPDNQDQRLRFGSVIHQCPKLTQLWLSPLRVNHGQFSPDGSQVLLAQFYGKAQIFDCQTGRPFGHPIGSKHGLNSATYSPDGRYVFTASESPMAILWDATTLNEVVRLPHDDRVYSGRFSPDGRLLVTSCRDGVARVWDIPSGQLKFSLPPHADALLCAQFSHSGQLLVTGSRDHTARLWKVADGKPSGPPLVHPTWVPDAAFSLDDRRVVTACDDHKAYAWDVATGARINPELHHGDCVRSVEFSPDGRLILTASLDGTARLWRARDLQPFDSSPILRHSERLTHATFSPDGRLILTTCIDGSARIWDLAGATGLPVAERRLFCSDASRYLLVTNDSFQVWQTVPSQPLIPFTRAGEILDQAQLTTDGRFVLTESHRANSTEATNHFFQVWAAETGRSLGPAMAVVHSLSQATLSDDGQYILLYGTSAARFGDPHTGVVWPTVMAHPAPVRSALFSPRNNAVITVSETNICVWLVPSGRPAYPPIVMPVTVQQVEFSRDGQYFVACCSDPGFTKCFAQVWAVGSGRPVGHPLRHGDGVLSASFNRDATRVVTVGEDFVAKIWELPTGRQIGLPLIHDEKVAAAAFSSDGKWVATAGGDRTARIWGTEDSEPLTPPLRHLVPLVELKFLKDDRQIITTDSKGNTYEWHLPVEDRPSAELAELAAFLGGGHSIPDVTTPKSHPEPIDATWNRLRTKYPGTFTTSAQDAIRWHAVQLEESESEQQWTAAAFHLQHLLKLEPASAPLLAGHSARIREHLPAGVP